MSPYLRRFRAFSRMPARVKLGIKEQGKIFIQEGKNILLFNLRLIG
jgi:hypothetical protein